MSFFSFLRPKKHTSVFHSDINGEITIGTSYRQKTLFASGVAQSGGEYVAMWKKSLQPITHHPSPITNCLVLGVGGGTVIQLIHEKYPDAHITAVDLDPLMIKLAREEFGIHFDELIHWSVSDAISFVKRKTLRGKYNLVIVDLYIGEFNPPRTRSKTFFRSIKRLLAPDGIILLNSHYRQDNPREFEDFKILLSDFFSSVSTVFSYPRNRILMLY